MSGKIPFNKPYFSGKELEYIKEAIVSGKISGDGIFTKKCHAFFEERYGFNKCLLTTSCTDALEMAAILCGIELGDEVILPSYTFVSTSNAFVLRGAKLVFCDSNKDEPNMDASLIEALITPRTKAIVVVHYAGVACDMDVIMDIAQRHELKVIEDAAQAIDSYYKGKPLGSFGDLAAFSFHETKNIISGEGGMLVINNPKMLQRAEVIREKGTNRSAYFRGEVDKYNWVDIGSSFLPSDIIAAYLFAQLEHIDEIQAKRKYIWQKYDELISAKGAKLFARPSIPSYATNNAHMYYLVCQSPEARTSFIEHLKSANIFAVFHYISLHKSPYYLSQVGAKDMQELPNCDRFSDQLVRLPLYFELSPNDQQRVLHEIESFIAKTSL